MLTTQPIERFFDYKAPEGGCFIGSFLEVPLGVRKVLGVVWGRGKGDFENSKIRFAIRVLDATPMRVELRHFLEKAGDYTLTPMSSMLRLATRVPGLGNPPATRVVYKLVFTSIEKPTEARKRVFDVILEYSESFLTLKELSA